MSPAQVPKRIKDLVFESLSLTHDGIGVFDADDVLVYCNEMLASMFGLPVEKATGMTFDQLIEFSYETGEGLNIETDYLPKWLDLAHRLRRSKRFRSFEVDLVNDQWFLVTEHTTEDDSMLIFCSEITQQKQSQAKMKELNQQLTEMAYRDPLTNLSNRRHFYGCAEIELSRCQRGAGTAAMLMLDIDFFKLINDRYGHETGDRVLVEVTGLVRDLLRNYDVFGRLGGEEFAILLPDTGLEEAINIGDRILDQIRKHRFSPPLETEQVTVSIGVAEIGSDFEDIDALMRLADEKLYLAKAEGRDRIRS